MHQSLTISDALLDQATILLNFGNEVAPRGQKTLEMINHVFEILNPLQRNILVENRWANPFAQLAETLWVLAGRNDMDWLERYIPQCRKWSDDGKCFTGDTLIKLLNGTSVPISSLISESEFYVYSYDLNDGYIKYGRGHSCRKTGKKKTLIVELDNGEYVKCTYDHLFLMRDGSYKEAQHLEQYDSIMPLYVEINKHGYEEVLHPDIGWEPTHRMVAYDSLCDTSAELDTVHHVDFNKRNNDPRNLLLMNFWDHFSYHSKMAGNRLKEKWKDSEYRNSMLSKLSESAKRRWKDSEYRDMMIDVIKHNWENEDYRAKMSNVAKRNWENDDYRNRMRNAVIKSNKTTNRKSTPKRRKVIKYMIDRARQHYVDNYDYMSGVSRENIKKANEKHKNDKKFIEHMKIVRSDNMKNINSDAAVKLSQVRGRILNVVKLLLEEGLEFNEENYTYVTSSSHAGIPRYSNILKYFDSFDELLDEVKVRINHYVVAIYEGDVEEVYDFTVDDYHNFALDSGIFVHNSWRAGYGPRLRNLKTYIGRYKDNDGVPYGIDIHGVDQVAYVISKLQEDPSTRQAVVSLWDPVEDTISGSKDYPCNNWLQFLIRDGKLYLSVVLRSNDLIYGFSHCDFYLWSVLQELVANCIGVDVGTMTWFAGSFHVYEKHWELLKEFRMVDVSVEPIQLDINTLNRFDTLLNELMVAEARLRNGPNSNLVDVFVKAEYEYFARRSEWFAVAYIMFVGWEMKLRGYSPVEIDSLLSVHLRNSDLYYSTMLYLFKENYEQMLQVTDSVA